MPREPLREPDPRDREVDAETPVDGDKAVSAADAPSAHPDLD